MLPRKHEVKPFSGDITSGHVGGILAKLYRIILKNLNIDDERHHALMARYVRTGEKLGIEDSRKSLDRELRKVVMTWKTFLKGLEPIQVKRTKVTIRLWPNDDENDCVFSCVIIDPKSTKAPGQWLSDLLMEAYIELGIHGDVYDRLMEDYILTTKSIIHRREKSSIRASLSKEILSGEITLRSFIKGLTLAKVKKLDITVELTHGMRKPTIHTLSCVLGEINQEDEDDE